MFQRFSQLPKIIETKSTFLLGPRQTGKSTLLRRSLPDAQYLDLLSPPLFRRLAAHPEALADIVSSTGIFIIDEVQMLPTLLNVVHQLIERYKDVRFVLTGSSARKLRSGGTNLLGGRARLSYLFPITTSELASSPDKISWKMLLERGGLPAVVTSNAPWEDLEAYVALYLQEEIRTEAAVRSLPDFARFLNVAGSCNGQQINFEKLGSDVGVSAKVIRAYMEILSDTLIAELLPPWRSVGKRKVVSAPKLFFFDVGVANFLKGLAFVTPGTECFGNALEHLVFTELKAHRSYNHLRYELAFWRTTSQLEVDFILAGSDALVAIEVKGTENPDTHDLKGLRAFSSEFPLARKILVCNTPVSERRSDGIEVLSAPDFFADLWSGRIHQAR